MGERTLRTTRSARIAFLGDAASEPPSEPARRPEEVWYVLHGYRQLAHRFIRRFEPVAQPSRLIVAPEALSRFYLEPRDPDGTGVHRVGASWMTREDRECEIEDYVEYLEAVAAEMEGRSPTRARADTPHGTPGRTPRGTPHRTLLGFSQGAHTAARWAVLGRTDFSRLVLWGAPLPDDLPAEAPDRLGQVEVVLVRGEEDELRRPALEERDEEWLRRNELRFRVVNHPGGHGIVSEVLEALARC